MGVMDAPEMIWAVTEPDDVSAQTFGEVYAQQIPDGMVGNPVKYVRFDLARPRVKPLVWEPTVDGAGHDHGVTVAWCPVFEKRFWSERPEKQAKIDATYRRILAALEE